MVEYQRLLEVEEKNKVNKGFASLEIKELMRLVLFSMKALMCKLVIKEMGIYSFSKSSSTKGKYNI